ncbi:glycerol-3-phosphate acyltransferase [Lyticum sinuosum]|uniref:Glycerol-3-phosphate acyltransferase n=1 Tax=Lyticum sinuosum TaxID=1332059 RepID=A0AAE4VKW5_9RICK|nr:glycerol-3-phosphate acyltransferase [Lyticum sinuosum]MDZ5761333.1 Glycerol-3-phosphate acyltransferase [Lyticum sinuosum]
MIFVGVITLIILYAILARLIMKFLYIKLIKSNQLRKPENHNYKSNIKVISLIIVSVIALQTIIYTIVSYITSNSFLSFILIIIHFVGSICGGPIIAYIYGIGDVLVNQGSKNTGATNMLRVGGIKLAVLTFSIDVIKGIGLTYIMLYILRYIYDFHTQYVFFHLHEYPLIIKKIIMNNLNTTLIMILVTIFHIFPIFPNIKGGKGVSVMLGSAIILLPLKILSLIIFIWISTFFIKKIVSLASIISSISLSCISIFSLFINIYKIKDNIENITDIMVWRLFPDILGILIVPAVIMYSHRENIKRILSGEEKKIIIK